MRHPLGFNRVLGGFIRESGPAQGVVVLACLTLVGVGNADAALQIAWESPSATIPQVLKDFTLEDLEKKKAQLLTEIDPLAKGGKESARFLGPSLSELVAETTKGLTAADRSTSDLVVLKTRTGKEALMPKAFLVKYPQIQLALKRNGQTLGAEAPRVVLPATTNSKIKGENILLEPLFLSELVQITLTSYEKRYGAFILTRRTDPAAMRGEKMYLQNCVSCHSSAPTTQASLASPVMVEKIAGGGHPEFPGVKYFKLIFDKKSTRSLTSYLEALKSQATAKN
jgi:hypothetical protein